LAGVGGVGSGFVFDTKEKNVVKSSK
jgi:hypothetical protein